MYKNMEKKWCQRPPRVLLPPSAAASSTLTGGSSGLPGLGELIEHRKGVKGAGSWLAGEKLCLGGKKEIFFFLEKASWHKSKPHSLVECHGLTSPPQNELGALQVQIWSTTDNRVLTAPCSTLGHPKCALLSGYIQKRNSKSDSLWQRGTELAYTVVLTLEVPFGKRVHALGCLSAPSPANFCFSSFFSALLGICCLRRSQRPSPCQTSLSFVVTHSALPLRSRR